MLTITAIAAQPAQKGEELDELSEVVVHGKDLALAIERAEDKFYLLFNELNKDDRYDTHCVNLQLDRDSRMQSRVCLPGFVADAMADYAPFKARCQPPDRGYDEYDCLDKNQDGYLSRDEAGVRLELDAQFMEIDADHDGRISRQEFPTDSSPEPVYQPPPPQLVLMEGSDAWYKHMTEVTNSDPRLRKMAAELGDLYHELQATQRRYNKLEAEVKQKKPGKSNAGPHAH